MNRNASPKPNAPNTLAWSTPLGAYVPPTKPRKVAKPNPWTKPIAGQVSK